MNLGTATADGFIPHAEVAFEGGVFLAPVKLRVRQMPKQGSAVVVRESFYGRLPVPLRYGSSLVYALPGGGELLR